MTNLDELKLSDLLPSSIKDKKEILAIAEALTGELQAITACINEIVMMPRIDELPENIIDSLAWQLHVDFYEPLGLDLDKKRALVKNSLSWHRRKGTKSVLVEVIRILFLDDFSIEEWYEYGGEPYFFRLIINDSVEDQQKFSELIRAVYELKNVRSWLELIRFQQEVSVTIYRGIVIKQVRKATIAANGTREQIVRIRRYTGLTVKQVRKTTAATHGVKEQFAKIQQYKGLVAKHKRRSTAFCC